MSSSISMRSTAGPRSGAGPGGGRRRARRLLDADPPRARRRPRPDRGIPPTLIVFATRFVRGSICETVPERLFATHRATSALRDAGGPLSDRNPTSTARVEGSIRVTVPSRLFATQIASRLATMGPRPSPGGIVSVTAPSPAGDDPGRSVLSLLSVTQTAPAPTAMPVGLLPTSKRSRTRLLAASILKTAASRALATQSDPVAERRRVRRFRVDAGVQRGKRAPPRPPSRSRHPGARPARCRCRRSRRNRLRRRALRRPFPPEG